MIKWWDKTDFFGKLSVHYQEGIIQLVKKPEETKSVKVTNMLKELFHSLTKEELKTRLTMALEELTETSTPTKQPTTQEKGDCSKSKRIKESSDSDEDDDLLSDSLYHDSQNPFDSSWP